MCKELFLNTLLHYTTEKLTVVVLKLHFVNRNMPQPNIPFYFDETLVESDKATTGLVQDELALNDLTHEQLKYRFVVLNYAQFLMLQNLEMALERANILKYT